MKRSIVSAALLAVSCGGGSDGQESPSDNTAARTAAAKPWTKLADGSRGALESAGSDKFDNVVLERCWPSGKKWDCLSVNTLHEAGSFDPPSLFLSRYIKEKLNDPESTPGSEHVRGGYSCQQYNGKLMTEYVFKVDDQTGVNTILKNDVLFNMTGGGSAWVPEYPARFMRENGIKQDTLYLNCYEVTKLALDNSVATLNSTALTYEMMVGKEASTPEQGN